MTGSIAKLLAAANHLPLWRREMPVDGGRLRAPSADRLLYLSLHRWVGALQRERARLRALLRPGMRVVEIGANIGVYTHVFGQSVGPTGKVTAFEPVPVLFAALEANMRRNHLAHVRTIRAAVGAQAGTARLQVGLFNSGDNRLSRSLTHASTEFVEAPVARADEFFAGERVDFVKIDVQGWETYVLRGMRDTIRANPQIVIFSEFWPYGLGQAGSSAGELLDELRHLGLEWEHDAGRPPVEELDLPALARRRLWFSNLLLRKAR